MALRVHSAAFLRTAVRAAEWPPGLLPEVAFVGRSNVGKSSMLNALTGRQGLARVSGTPGRTQALQFFEVEVQGSGSDPRRRIRLTDLPGYGYAKAPRAERDRWGGMIEEYLKERNDLRAVVIIVDARHPPQPSDHEALAFVAATGRRVVVAVTKMDKLTRNQQKPALRRAEKDLGIPAGDAVPFSAVERTGADALWAWILTATR